MANALPNGSAPLNKMAARAINRKKALKDFFCKNSQCMDFEIIIQECSFGDCLQKLLKAICSVEQNGCQGYK